ncbi:STAS domain-containing protein [Mycolicibacterium stellerae]|uniref:STAS domain-containing protein n=1 Tax=Mycolicibacterium stellerae TaxID=2358193 RepID=UPI000F0B0D53|nr:STAS domain-containing protein [Mycolicibacterium stellerae]
MSQACTLTVTEDSVDGATVLTPDGVLDSSTYRALRDEVIEAALGEPRAVIVDVSRLSVPADSSWSVFSSARWHVDGWPSTPIVLVCEHQDMRTAFGRCGASRWVSVHPTIKTALATLQRRDVMAHRARAALPADPSSLRRSRDLVERWLTAWAHTDLIPVTQVIVTALVENVLQHTDSGPDIRLQADGATVTVAVDDASRVQASLGETPTRAGHPLGMRIVNALCRQWGNAPTRSGKTVWVIVGRENRI